MRRFQLSLPTILFGVSFVLSMVVALLFINREAAEEGQDSSARKSSSSKDAVALASLPSEALPREPLAYSAQAPKDSPGESAKGTTGGAPASNIVSEALEARNARAASMVPNGENPPMTGSGYPQANAPAPAATGYAVAQSGYGNQPPAAPGQATAPNPYPYSMPPQPAMAAAPPIAIPPEFAPRQTPVPTPQPTYAPPQNSTWYPTVTNHAAHPNSLESLRSGNPAPTPMYSTADLYKYLKPRRNGRAGYALPAPRQTVAAPAYAASRLPVDQTLLPGTTNPAWTPLPLHDGTAITGEQPAWNPGSLDPALAPAPSLSDGGAMDELPVVTITPAAGDLAQAVAPAMQPPLSLSTPSPVVTPDPRQLAMASAMNPAPAQRQNVSISKGGATVNLENVAPGYARKDAAGSKEDVEKALKALEGYSGKVSPQPGQAPGSIPAVPTAAPALVRPGQPTPAPTPIEYIRPAFEAAAGTTAPEKPLPPEVLAKLNMDPSQPDVAAKVGEKKLSAKDVSRRVEAMLRIQGKSADADRKVVLGRLVAEEWAQKTALAEEAKRQGLTVSDQEVREFTERAKQRFSGKVEDALRAAGFSDEEVREEMRTSALCDKMIETSIGRKYDDAKLRQIYEKSPDEFQPSRRLRVAEIVKEKKSGAQAAEEAARQLQRQASSGGDFSQLAAAQSDASSRANGGDLGWLDDRNAAKITPAMAKALEKLKPGQVSDVVETENGYAVYKLVEVEEPKKGFEGARDRVIASLKEREREAVFEEVRKRTPVVLAHQEKKASGARVVRGGESAPTGRSSAASAPRRNRSSEPREVAPAEEAAPRPEELQAAVGAPPEEMAAQSQGEAPRTEGRLSRIFKGFTGRNRGDSAPPAGESAEPGVAEPAPQAAQVQSAPAAPAPARQAPGEQPAGFGGPTGDLNPAGEPEPARKGLLSRILRN